MQEVVARISVQTELYLKSIYSDIEVVRDCHNEVVINEKDAINYLTEDQYERIEWCPSTIGLPKPKPRKKS